MLKAISSVFVRPRQLFRQRAEAGVTTSGGSFIAIVAGIAFGAQPLVVEGAILEPGTGPAFAVLSTGVALTGLLLAWMAMGAVLGYASRAENRAGLRDAIAYAFAPFTAALVATVLLTAVLPTGVERVARPAAAIGDEIDRDELLREGLEAQALIRETVAAVPHLGLFEAFRTVAFFHSLILVGLAVNAYAPHAPLWLAMALTGATAAGGYLLLNLFPALLGGLAGV